MRSRSRGVRFGPSVVVALPLALVSMLAMAGSNSTTLPNGAALTVSIDDPVTSTEFEVPPGQPSINVPVSGTASVGLGEPDATFVYVIDVSGSTTESSGSACGTFLQCQQDFFNAFNAEIIASGQADLVGLAVYAGTEDGVLATSGATADMSSAGGDQKLVAPDADGFVATVINSTFSNAAPGVGGVGQFQNRTAGFRTNFAAGMQRACEILSDGSNDNSLGVVVFASDGESNEGGGQFQSQLDCLKNLGARIESIAIGANSSCGGGTDGTLQEMANQTGGTCHPIDDPDDLPDIIPQLIGSTLESLQIAVDGNPPQTIPNGDISLPLPQPGAVSVNYTTPANGLGPGDHTICVTANGSDVTGGTASVTQCETIHLLQLSASPADVTNQLGAGDNQHTVTATIAGPASHIGGRVVTFSVAGQNAGATGTCSPTPDCKTDASGQVSFTYSVPIAPSSIGNDTINVSTQIAGHTSSVSVVKRWVDTTPPTAACPEGVNPGGHQPPASNEDGFFLLTAADAVDPNPSIFVVDLGTGTVFGPFPSGTNVKYTQAPGATPSIKPGSGDVDWKIKGQGDMGVYAVDGNGNQSATVSCLVPPPPK